MICQGCEDHDGSRVPAVAMTTLGLPACAECIRRDHHRVKWECSECGNECVLDAEHFLDGDWRCDECAAKESRELDEAAEHAWRNR